MDKDRRNEQLVDAGRQVALKDGAHPPPTPAGFAELCRQSRKRTSKALEDYYWSERRYDLDKKELNRRLAELVAPELRGKAQRTVKEYEFEKVARDIFRRLGGLNVEDSSDVGRVEQV